MTQKGDPLPTIERVVTQDQIEKYARASGDFNPIHIDHDFAASTQFGGTIAHGMMVAATISEMMTAAFGRNWAESGSMKIRFRSPVKPGQRITTQGSVRRVDAAEGIKRISCTVSVVKDDGETAIAGQAEVRLSAGSK
ncbi:MAG: MaoC family dehydratase [Dehalococcoidia bacterium]|nr:MaoC family dehydratase [Dehalococcoidia bacterium]